MIESTAGINVRRFIAVCFSGIFFMFAALLGGLTLHGLITAFADPAQIAGAAAKAINTAVVALAAFELGLVVAREYGDPEDGHITVVLRRTVPRFISIVCIALALEGLLLVVKYSQTDVSGNLPYAVAIVVSAAILLMALAGFLRLTRHPIEEPVPAPASPVPATQGAAMVAERA
jgi:hypothetical protein